MPVLSKTLLLLTLSVCAFGADKDYNGRWNLTVKDEPRGRVWWIEVNGAGGSKINGRFVGFPGGQMDNIPVIKVDHKELHWSYEGGGKKLTYVASIQGGKLIGTQSIDGKPTRTFVGERAPEIRDRDDERWKPTAPIELFNGRDLEGWQPTFPGRGVDWSVKDGITKNAFKASDIRTAETFWNFELHAEYRYEKGSNSGIGLRGRYEVQIEDTAGLPIDGHSQGGIYSRLPPAVQAAKAAGEWQTLDVRLVGRIVTVKLNGQVTVDHKVIEGPTAMCFDPDEAMPGPIAVQGDHGVVEFRKLTITPLSR